MKRFWFFAALFCVGYFVMALIFPNAKATNFSAANRGDTFNGQLTTGASYTNATTSVLYAEQFLYHTFQYVNSGTSNVQAFIDWSLDNTNWIIATTNTFTSGTTTNASLTGKFTYFRVRVNATNSAVVVNYLGGN